MNLSWETDAWTRRLDETDGDPLDRVAQTGHELLSAGFCVRVLANEARARMIGVTFAVHNGRRLKVVACGRYAGWFALSWPGRNNTLYQAARRLSGSRWDSQRMIVPPSGYKKITAFAERHQFVVGQSASSIIEAQEAAVSKDVLAWTTPDA